MHARLSADGPMDRLRDRLMLYGQFVGGWQVRSVHYTDGGTRETDGEWHFAWVLGGMGVQDILFPIGSPPSMSGTTLRCFDERLGIWHISWMQPAAGEFANLIGWQAEDGIIQEGRCEQGEIRWTFTDITANSFRWRGYESDAASDEWRLVQEMRAERMRGPT